MKKFFFRPLSVILAVVLLVVTLPLHGMVTVSAIEATPTSAAVAPPDADNDQGGAVPISEVEAMRTADSKTVLNNDGSYSSLGYPWQIHFEDGNGGWQEYDNSLVDHGDFYSPRASGVGLAMPKALGGENRITLANGIYQFAIGVPSAGYALAPQEIVSEETDAQVTQPATEPTTEMPTETTTEAITEVTADTQETTTAAPEAATGETTVPSEAATETEDEVVDVELETYASPNELEASEFSVQAVPSEAIVLEGENNTPSSDFTVVENLMSSLVYPNAFPGANLQYDILPGMLKEYVIVSERSDAYAYNFTLDLENLVAVQQDERTIHLLSAISGDLQIVVAAPYAIDAAGELNEEALTLSLNGNILSLIADAAWMNAPERAYPVKLDPSYTYTPERKDLTTATVASAWNSSGGHILGHLRVGHEDRFLTFGSGNTMRSLVQFDLPPMPNDAVVTQAELVMVSKDKITDTNKIKIGAHRINQFWKNNVTWNNSNGNGFVDAAVLDIGHIKESKDFPGLDSGQMEALNQLLFFNITAAVKEWHEEGKDNFGIMLKALNENAEGVMTFLSPNAFFEWILETFGDGSVRPTIAVQYRNNVGLEDYWTYETVEMNRAGTAHVNQYSGGLTYVHPDASLDGERMPVALAHTYTSAREHFNASVWNMRFGMGFRLNLIEELSQEGDLYTLVDGTGAVHYFKKINAGDAFYTDENNSEIKLYADTMQIKDALGNTKKYTAGIGPFYLTAVEDSNGNVTTIQYNNGRIDYIEDTVQRRILLDWDGQGYLERIRVPVGDNIFRKLEFAYDNSKGLDALESIKYFDETGKEEGETQFVFELRSGLNPSEAFGTHLNAVINITIDKGTSGNEIRTPHYVVFDYEPRVSRGQTGYCVTEIKQGLGSHTEGGRVSNKPDSTPNNSLWARFSRWVYNIVWNMLLRPSWFNIDANGRWYFGDKRPEDEFIEDEIKHIYNLTEIVQEIDLTYRPGTTKVENSLRPEQATTYLFDFAGRTVGVQNGLGESAATSYAPDAEGARNLPASSADGRIVRNLLKNPSNELGGNDWTSPNNATLVHTGNENTFAYDRAWWTTVASDAFAGERSWALDQGAIVEQTVKGLSPGTYTVSGYFKGGSAQLSVLEKRTLLEDIVIDSVETVSVDEWERFSITFELKNKRNAAISIASSGDYVLVDAVQLEASGGASAFNFVSNSFFSNGADRWTVKDGSGTVNNDAYVLQGNPGGKPTLQQEFPMYGKEGQMVTFGANARATAVSSGTFNVTAAFYFRRERISGDTIREKDIHIQGNTYDFYVGEATVPFVSDIRGHAQSAMKSHSLAGDVTHARLFINYHNQPEGKTHELTVYDAFMYLNAGGSNYDYKENSTKIDSMNTGAGTMVFTYDTQPNREADIVKITIDRPDGLREITDITYDAAHNITQTKETKDVKGAEFDASGQAVSQTIDGKEGLKTRTISKITDYEYEDRGIGKGGVLKSVTVKEEVDGQVTATAKQRIDYAAGHKLNDISVITDENSGLTKTYDYENRFHNVLKSATGFDGVENKLGFNTKNLLTTIDSGRFGNTYEYDGGDRLASIESNGTEYAFQYDDAGMLEESEIAGNPIAAHTYDERRRLKQTLYANGDMGGYKPEYDDKTGFLTNELFWDEGPAPSGDAQFSYLYDNSGLLTQVSNRELLRTTNYGYDVSGRLADILTTNNGNAQALVQQSRARLKYNNHGALDNLTVTANDETLSETTYSYDELGRPLAAELDALGGSLLTNTYASLDRLARQTLILPSEDMVATNYTYLKDDQDVATGFVSEMETVLPTSDEQFKFGYEWDGTNIKKITENGNNAEAQVYFYDAIGQLVRENDLEYVYDDGGNLAAIRDFDSKAVKHKFEYEKPWKDQLTKYDGKPLTYDKLGNLKSYDGVNYTWEKGGLLTEINGNGQDVQYAYDHSGLRSKKIVDGKTTEFIWAGEMLMAQITEDYTIAWSYDSSGKMIGFTLDSVPYFYIRNLMGDVTGIMDAGGALVARYTYDAWGNILRAEDLISAPFEDAGAELDDDIEKNGDDMEDPNVDSDHENDEFEDEYVQYSIAEINPIRYRGYYRDAETEYYYCQSRYYNPEWRRWISADIFFDTGMGVLGTNMYAYCNNNPVMYVDPTGSALLSDILGLVDSLMQFWDENRDWIVPAVNLAIVGFVGFWAFVGISAVGIGALTYFVGIPLLNMARDRLRDYRDGLPEPTTDGEKFLHGALKFADGLLSALIVTAHIVVVASIVTTVTSAVMSVAGITAFGVWNVFVGIMDTAWLVWDKFRMEIDGGDDDDEINALSTQAAARGIAVQAAANTTTIDLFRIVTAKNTKINLTLGNTRNLEITLTQTVSASISGMYLTGYDNEKWGLSDGLKATKGKVRVEGSRAKGWSLRSIAANGTGRGTLTLTATVYYS